MLDLSQLQSAVRYEGGVSRRLFLAYGAALSALPTLGFRTAARAKAVFADNPFTLGVASGEPTESGVVIWTKLAPKPLENAGGMTPEFFDVAWEVAADEQFKDVAKRGTAVATPQLGHSVHVEVGGLNPDRWYFYRFRAGDAVSVVGRTRTTPEPTAKPDKLTFAVANCQHYEQGLFTAYGHMAKDDLDLVIHLGDYIYEYAAKEKQVRKHHGKKCFTLEEYRARHSQYRADPLLNAMHAKCPWVVTWDDHEFENDYANDIPERRFQPIVLPAGWKDGDPLPKRVEIPPPDRVTFLEQRANAYQAYYEMMPLRRASVPRGPDMKIYRTVNYGRLASFQVLDTRQYRTDQPKDGDLAPLDAEALDPRQTILGAAQAGWLKSALVQSSATWNVLAQQVLMGMVDGLPGPGQMFSMEKWSGYAHERIKLMKFIQERHVPNPVVLTGDIHSHWALDLRVDDRDQTTPVVAAEFVATSISSGGNGQKVFKGLDTLQAENPFVKFHGRQRGYLRCTVTPKVWKTDYQVAEEVTKPGGGVTTAASFVAEAGTAGLKKA